MSTRTLLRVDPETKRKKKKQHDILKMEDDRLFRTLNEKYFLLVHVYAFIVEGNVTRNTEGKTHGT
jgi:hypothetical protein